MESNHQRTIPLAEYGQRHGMSAEQLIEAVREKRLQMTTINGKKHIVLPKKEMKSSPRASETAPGSKPSLARRVMRLSLMTAVVAVIVTAAYVGNAYYWVQSAASQLSTATDESGLETIATADIKKSLADQLTLENTAAIPETKEAKIEHVRRYFAYRRVKNTLPSVEGIRSILATGSYQQVENVPAVVDWSLYESVQVRGVNRFDVLINNGSDGPVRFQFERDGVRWQLSDIKIPT